MSKVNPYSTHNIKVEFTNENLVVFNDKISGCVMWWPIGLVSDKKAKRIFNSFLKNVSLNKKLKSKYWHQK